MEDFLFLTVKEYELKIHSFVMMPNHFHMLVSTPNANLGRAMNYFLRETSKEFGRMSGIINQTYGGRYYKTLIDNYHYFMNAYKYVYRNPVRARIGRYCEEYPYSTLSGLCGRSSMRIPLINDVLLFSPVFDQDLLDWMNRAPRADDEYEIKRALKRPVFELKPSRAKRTKSDLETHLY